MITVGCAWHDPSGDGTDGICDDCMQKVFSVDPASIHAEIAAESGTLPVLGGLHEGEEDGDNTLSTNIYS